MDREHRAAQFFPLIPEHDILEMQYRLLKDRGMQPDGNMPSRTLLYFYSLNKKERDEQARLDAMKSQGKGSRTFHMG